MNPGRRREAVGKERGMPGRRGGLITGVIGALVFALVVWYFLRVDQAPRPQPVAADSGRSTPVPSPALPPPGPDEEPQSDFVAMMMDDTGNAWTPLFKEVGFSYKPPNLVQFSGSVDPTCGFEQAAMGSFYCPGDRKLYLDLDFIRDLRERFQAAGDLAEAYVIAHEIGHHVQNLMGTNETVKQLLLGATADEANTVSVIAELQADCYAGIWANHAGRGRQIVEKGNIEAALSAVAATAEDRHRLSNGPVTPDPVTHGTSEQRVRWFRTGLTAGDILSCETFTAPEL